jgi:membrane protease YdiL (CAAX protease family)
LNGATDGHEDAGRASLIPHQPPPLSRRLFWGVVASTVGLWGVQSVASLAVQGPKWYTASDLALLSVVGLELVLLLVWVPVLRRRGWTLDVITTRASVFDLLRGAALYVATLVAWWIFYDLARLVAPHSAAAVAQAAVRERASVSWGPVIALSIVNPIVEEAIYLGFLANILRRHGTAVALGASVLARVVVHLYQGPFAAVSHVSYGLIFAAFYLDDRRLWPPVVAHGLADLASLARFVGR